MRSCKQINREDIVSVRQSVGRSVGQSINSSIHLYLRIPRDTTLVGLGRFDGLV